MQLTFAEHLARKTDAGIYRVFDELPDFDDEEPATWLVEPIRTPVLDEKDGYFLIRALNIVDNHAPIDCYIDLTLPEGIPDHVYFFESGTIIWNIIHHCEGNIIAAVPIVTHVDYELYYSKLKPDLGIRILREGLKHARIKGRLADALGYILRDENRVEEAIEAFTISVNEGGATQKFQPLYLF